MSLLSKAGGAALALAAAVVVLDQAVKHWILNTLHLPELASVPVAGPLKLTMVWNEGVSFGLLQAQGHRVTYVTHGLGALAELSNARFDLMLLDLDLPGVDGFQVARMVRQREAAGEHLAIVAITARSGGDEEARARAAGMDGFARKPISGAQLAEVIESVLVQLPREETIAGPAS